MVGVQTEACSEGTLNVGWTDAGDTMDYSVNVATAGTYTVTYRYASTVATGSLNLVAGSTSKNIVFANSGGWQTWQNATSSITLNAGVQTIRLAITAPGFNLNYFSLSLDQVVVGGGTFEAEKAALSAKTLLEGAQVILTASGATLTWSNVNMGAVTKATVYYSNGEPAGDLIKIKYNGTQIGGNITLQSFNAWSGPFTTAVASFAAQSGTGTIVLEASGSGWIAAIDKIVLGN